MAAPNRTHANRWCKSAITREVYDRIRANPQRYGLQKKATKAQCVAIVNLWWEIAGEAIFDNLPGLPHGNESRVYIEGIGEIGRRWMQGGRSVNGLNFNGVDRSEVAPGWSLYLKGDQTARDALTSVPLDPPAEHSYPERVEVLASGDDSHLSGFYDKAGSFNYFRDDDENINLQGQNVGNPRWLLDQYLGPADGNVVGFYQHNFHPRTLEVVAVALPV